MIFGLLMIVGTVNVAWCAERQIVLREQIRREWRNELVTYPFEAERGACKAESVRLVGPEGPIAVQLSNVERWPGTEWVRSARLSFVVSHLAPLAANTYTITYGKEPARIELAPADLRIRRGDGFVEVLTSRFGVRLLLGEKTYEEPLLPEAVPGPVLGMRLADGTWFGGSRMYGDGRIAGYSAVLTGAGPVSGEVRTSYTYEDGTEMTLTAQLAAGGSQVLWGMDVRPVDIEQVMEDLHSPWAAEDPLRPEDPARKDGWDLLLTPGLDGLRMVATPEFYDCKWGKHEYIGGRWVAEPVEVELAKEPVGWVCDLVPWSDWWKDTTKTAWTFKTPTRGETLRIEAREPGIWVEPAAPGTWVKWSNRRMCQKWIPLLRGEDGAIFFRISAASGQRRWQIGGPQGAQRRRLDVVKDLVLDWPSQTRKRHPYMFLNRDELKETWASNERDEALLEHLRRYGKDWQGLPHGSDAVALGAYLLSGSAEVAAETRVTERLSHHLNLLGEFDTMRHTCLVAALYDALIDSDLISEKERHVLRAQMAYLAYRLADPETWSMERGYCSGNLNMSVSHVLNKGMAASALADHPMAREWIKPALNMTDRFLKKVGPKGEWPESVSNYAHVSASSLLVFAVAARSAGFDNFVDDPRMKRLLLFLAKQYTPPDPRAGGEREPGLSRIPPLGRGGAGGRNGLPGLMARGTAQSDPAYSRALQWVWLRTGATRSIPNRPLGGFEYVVLDRSLPAERPDWGSEFFPEAGVLMRHGLGTDDEWYVYFAVERQYSYPSESGGFPVIFARGVPISSRFAGGYAEREELFISRVLPARARGTDEERRARFCHEGKREVVAFSTLPAQDYAAADIAMERPKYVSHESGAFDKMKPVPEWPPVPNEASLPIEWLRQVLFIKDKSAAGANYLVLRDTVSGGQPTIWQFWTVSEKIGGAEEVRNLAEFLADRPGEKAVPPRELKGDRFTAVGQFDMDIEFYVASPTDTPRYTLRWGTTYPYHPIHRWSEYQDMLHLQMTGDGAYYVAIFPREREEHVPTFRTLGEGKIIEVSGQFGTDYAFLSAEPAADGALNVSFEGTAGSVQDRRGVLILSLGAPGSVRYGGYALRAETAASLRIAGDVMTVEVQKDRAGVVLTLTPPGNWELEDEAPGLKLVRDADLGYVLHVPAGAARVSMMRK